MHRSCAASRTSAASVPKQALKSAIRSEVMAAFSCCSAPRSLHNHAPMSARIIAVSCFLLIDTSALVHSRCVLALATSFWGEGGFFGACGHTDVWPGGWYRNKEMRTTRTHHKQLSARAARKGMQQAVLLHPESWDMAVLHVSVTPLTASGPPCAAMICATSSTAASPSASERVRRAMLAIATSRVLREEDEVGLVLS